MPRTQVRPRASYLPPPAQSLGPGTQSQPHWQEEDEISEIGHQGDTEIVDETHDETAYKGAEQASRTAEDDHDQRERQHVGVEPGIGVQDRASENAANSGEGCSQQKDRGEKAGYWNSDGTRHLHIVDASA